MRPAGRCQGCHTLAVDQKLPAVTGQACTRTATRLDLQGPTAGRALQALTSLEQAETVQDIKKCPSRPWRVLLRS